MDKFKLKEIKRLLIDLSSETLAYEYMSEQSKDELLKDLKEKLKAIIEVTDEGIQEYEEVEKSLADISDRINSLRNG